MWEKKKQESEEIKAVLGKGAEFSGKLIFNGSVRIDGDFQGEISGQGTLVVGEGAVVKANINVQNVYINGDVQGNIDAKNKVHIHSTGKFSGDIRTTAFVMEEGAFFDGTSSMSNSGKKNTNDSLYG
ncbi:MAG: polymer-forming cytoskeletal protein [Smithellaceae bacterium]|jgi:cytoskeletal protein CcmA (bactofilin family)|nr:polymer-forming cytoskeletal protein [Syntrophaceae bacterium]NMD05080.1 polymer-forming cytoskeletal protein [Deltaproteobacteria bacterium]OPZ54084.1 MAG: Polymer-forming cytoskeletal [Deltaproteobacteria bacterium ADurb.BinA014]HPM70108.1 polymer-forming cytoskeletal protein [Smithellaceae bacterium]MBP8608101.1 polymer-forming cytoskeletal protein [Syntrophaceae bacterium]